MKKVWVQDDNTDVIGIKKIGDSIWMTTVLNYWVQKEGCVEYGPRLNEWVARTLPATKFILNSDLKKEECDYVLFVNDAWTYVVQHGQGKMHIIDGLSFSSGLGISLDKQYPFPKKDIDFDVDIVLAPFGAEVEGLRIWQKEKWLALIEALPGNKWIIGSAHNDYSWLPSDVNIAVGQPIRYIAGLLDKCLLFVSIDSGPSALANALGIRPHVLIYPHLCSITENVHAVRYQVGINHNWKYVTDIPVQPVLNKCLEALGD